MVKMKVISNTIVNIIDGIMNPTNLIIAGKTVVVSGYGWCGKGVAMRAKGMGANVIVTEIDPVKGIEAVMDGCRDVIRAEHFDKMKDGVLLANSGHFDVEIDKQALAAKAVEVWERKPNITGYRMPDGRILNLMAEGRLVNLAAGNGHPAEIMDMSFGIQAKSLEYLVKHAGQLEKRVYQVPREIDAEVAGIKLASLGATLDVLSDAQREYLKSYN